MADPTPYIVNYSFGGFQANNPTSPLPGTALDNELLDIATAIVQLVTSLKDLRREDGALNNGIVTFESLDLAVQLMLDPSNATLVANAVAAAQASATAAGVSQTASAASAASALASAIAAAASAGTVNLSLYLAKANNLANLGSTTTSRANLGLGSVATFDVGVLVDNIVQLVAGDKLPAVDGSLLTGIDTLPPGTLVWSTGAVALPTTVKANGALLSRASFPRLWTYANASGNIVSEAAWAASSGSYSTGDLSTTFRVLDVRGEFVRGFDDGRGIDAGRVIGARQADSLKDHTHTTPVTPLAGANNNNGGGGGAFGAMGSSSPAITSSSPSTGAAAETRPRNIPLLGCIRY